MNFDEIIKKVYILDGNLKVESGDLFISTSNLLIFSELLANCSEIEGVLITPYLVTPNHGIYELHYYEFEIEITDVIVSYYIDHSENNCLPSEIVNNIKPKAIVSQGDKKFFINVLNKYIFAMGEMEFKHDKTSNPDLLNANLFFQIY